MKGLSKLAGRVIAFEGLDGAGKSTVISVLRRRLRDAGCTVFLPREGKDHSSRPARLIRLLTRDRCNLDLRPRAEMALYCAREAQIIEEQVRPAIARGDTVLLDRAILTAVVLGAYGRGLPRSECEAVAAGASGGLEPDVTVILDVHPRTSRIRKRLGRARDPKPRDPSRKGMSGTGLKERVREGYREIAAERGYLLFHTERIGPDEVARRVVEALATGARPSDLEHPDDRVPQWMVDPSLTFEDALAGLPPDLALYMSRSLIAGRSHREAAAADDPQLVAWAMDAEDPLRSRLVEVAPEHALSGLVRCPLSGPEDLRERMVARAPAAVARALRMLDDPRSDALRAQLVEHAPGEVIESLCGRDDDFAEQLRDAHWDRASVAQAATSLIGCQGPRAWPRRRDLFARDPALALRSLRGVDDSESRALLERYAPLVPKMALRGLFGNGSDFAHALRRALVSTGREVIDSLGALDDDAALSLREDFVDQWPSTVLGSLLRVNPSPRVEALRNACLDHGAGDVHVLRQHQGHLEWDQRPDWKRVDDDAMED